MYAGIFDSDTVNDKVKFELLVWFNLHFIKMIKSVTIVSYSYMYSKR